MSPEERALLWGLARVCGGLVTADTAASSPVSPPCSSGGAVAPGIHAESPAAIAEAMAFLQEGRIR